MDQTEANVSTPKKFSRDQIREAVLNSKADNEIVEAFGVTIEIKYPSLTDLLEYRGAEADDNIMARAIIKNCYVPGTNERVFEDADMELLMEMKFTPDMRRLNGAINKILAGDEAILKEVEDNTKSNKE